MTASTHRPPRTIEIAAASLRRRLGARGIACVTSTDVTIGDDSGDVLCFFLIADQWQAESVSIDAVPNLTPQRVLDLVLRAAIEPRMLH